ncbi:hypothetical protein SAMN02745166_02846 [Prosthecobacter debontii]|uniref:Uncharacterized protein n=1 Tax=Prosthecobacter debontii TaxID=48467 RepID=A0A1T4YAJ3_9BACT|nr:hypothetical protein [Prosthecobacter debontii]SKA98710.1 hypothetical protein SAMN02745166_02846 [Prosthecobacter debontii]
MKTTTTLLRLLTLLSPTVAWAAEPDPDLPQPFDPNVLAPVVTSSPFTRMVNMSDNLVLTGIAYIDGKPVATIFNMETKESHIVGTEPNFQGWTLQEAHPAPDISRSQAKISIGGEVVSVRYASLTAKDMKPNGKPEQSERSDRGGPPGGDRFRGNSRGPSDEDRKRYESLSEKSREKFRDMMRSKFSDEKFRNAPEEERRNIIRKEFERIEKEDKGGR